MVTARIFSVEPRLASSGGLHGLRIGMHGEKGRARMHDALDALVHGVADVVQLEIEEYLLAGA